MHGPTELRLGSEENCIKVKRVLLPFYPGPKLELTGIMLLQYDIARKLFHTRHP